MAIHAQYQGIEFDLNNDAMSDFNTLEQFYDAQAGDLLAVVGMAHSLFGKEQFGSIKNALPDTRLMTVLNWMNGAVRAAAEAVGESAKN